MKPFFPQAAATAGLLLALSSGGNAQSTAEEAHKATEHAHLVGHEDEILLARIEDALAEWNPRNLTSPYLKEIQTEGGKKHALRRPDLAEFIADPDAALALGKAFFWDMQAGSDFGTKGKEKTGRELVLGTACASCHYRHGADARDKNTTAIAFQSWDKFAAAFGLPATGTGIFAQRAESFLPNTTVAAAGAWNLHRRDRGHDIVGSQGVVRKQFDKALAAGNDQVATPETFVNRDIPFLTLNRADMFVANGARVRQVTQRNSPSVINAVFNDRQFHDGRAESTFNGFSLFGDFDKSVILEKAVFNSQGKVISTHPVSIAIPNASLASQAVGPIVNEIEMSAEGRTFHDVAVKLLGARPLALQSVDVTDSVLSAHRHSSGKGLRSTYRRLIQKAFRKEWWAGEDPGNEAIDQTIRTLPGRLKLRLLNTSNKILGRPQSSAAARPAADAAPEPAPPPPDDAEGSGFLARALRAGKGANITLRLLDRAPIPRNKTRLRDEILAQDKLLVQNFSLFWGLSIMLYESTLVSNDTPFDDMLRGKGEKVEARFSELVTAGLISPPTPPNPAPVDPAEPATDDILRKAQLDKFSSLNAPPVLTGTAMFQRGFRVFVRNCAECHEPPFFTTAGEIELDPEIPLPIAKLHTHALVRTALADAFKERFISTGNHPGGVTDQNRPVLGDRRFFFDQERIPEVEALVGPLLIENMPIDDVLPLSFNQTTPPPRQPRVPMITWRGTRPPLEYAASPQPGEDPLDPYAFYDLGYYNIGTSEPSYDWGIWTAPDPLSVPVEAFIKLFESSAQPGVINLLKGAAGITAQQFTGITIPGSTLQPADLARVAEHLRLKRNRGLNDLGSANRLPDTEIRHRLAALNQRLIQGPDNAADESANRAYLEQPQRQENEFFKRARRMVMSGETWGHRKPFISDNELMGWGAFKTPGLRNVALTEPYMHNGRFLTLRQVLEFYSFDNVDIIPADQRRNPDLHPEVGRLGLNADGRVNNAAGVPTGPVNLTQVQDAESLLFFLHCLTDERVRTSKAPFDHPGIIIPNGYENVPDVETAVNIPPAGRNGLPGASAQFPASR